MKRLYLIVSFIALSLSISAQNVTEFYNMSQQNNALSTARVSSMGGAFTSLGADVSSININPAGISMFRSNGAIAITPSLSISSVTGNSTDANQRLSTNSKNTYGDLSNIGFVYNIKTRGVFKNVAFGFNYNSAYNTQSDYTINGLSSNSSIIDMFASQLYGVNPNSIAVNYGDVPASLFGAVGAFHTGLVFFDEYSSSQHPEYRTTTFNDAGEEFGSIFPGDIVNPELKRYVKNKTNDYNFALAFNVNDFFHIGTTIGYSEYNFKQFDDYTEIPAIGNKGDLYGTLYGQELYQNGSSFNFIFGVTIQPIKNLRIGATIQAPKVYSITEEYSTKTISEYIDDLDTYSSDSPVLTNNYKIRTPTRFNSGISYAFGKSTLLSVDYERVWYNKMKYSDFRHSGINEDINKEINETYKATNNLRAGIEVLVPGGISLRGGYAYYGNANKLVPEKYGVVKNISGGIGFKTGGFSIDLAYINSSSKVAPFKMYSYSYSIGDKGEIETIESTSISDAKIINHNIFLTLIWRL